MLPVLDTETIASKADCFLEPCESGRRGYPASLPPARHSVGADQPHPVIRTPRHQALPPLRPGDLYRRGDLVIALNPGSHTHDVRLARTGDAETVLAHHCRVAHDADGWNLHIGSRGYGVFGTR